MTPEEKKAHLKEYRRVYHQMMRYDRKDKLREYYERQKERGHTRYWVAKEDRQPQE